MTDKNTTTTDDKTYVTIHDSYENSPFEWNNSPLTSGGFTYTTASPTVTAAASLSSIYGGAGGVSSHTYNLSGPGYSNIFNNSTITSTASPYLSGHHLQVNGNANIDGELKINGVNLNDRLNKIEERLAILRPNADLEERWNTLKELGDKYRELEKELIEKELAWSLLKK